MNHRIVPFGWPINLCDVWWDKVNSFSPTWKHPNENWRTRNKKTFCQADTQRKKKQKKLKLKFFFTEKRRRYYQNRGKKRERERIQLLQFWYELGKDNITSRLSQIHKLLKGEGNICVFSSPIKRETEKRTQYEKINDIGISMLVSFFFLPKIS